MGWSVGNDSDRPGRFIGYGVPATCDHPDCNTAINRGLAHTCGGGIGEHHSHCGLHFCPDHLMYADRGDWHGYLCERCRAGQDPFPAKPDTAEWTQHVLTDDTWATFRAENATWRGYTGEAA